MKRPSDKCRIRPMSCPDCGYHQWGTRSWWARGLPTCPCGGTIQPTKPADLAFCGLITMDDVGQAEWNRVCRENGWAITRNQGQAARTLTESVLGRSHAAHCVYPGCGRWVAETADVCTAGHAQHDHAVAEATPF